MTPTSSSAGPAPPKGTTTVRELLDWAKEMKKPPRAAPLPQTSVVYKTPDGTEYPIDKLASMDTGDSAELSQLKVLAKAGVKQQDSPRGAETEKLKKAAFIVKVSGGPRKVHDASIAVATNMAIQECLDLRQLSLYDNVVLEICAQGYVNHFFKKLEEKMTSRKLNSPKQIRSLRVPGLNHISHATSLVTTIPIAVRVLGMVASYPLNTDLFFLYVMMNFISALVAKLINLVKAVEYWDKRQVLLTLPKEFLDVPAVREVVGIHSEVDSPEKAFMLWASLNPGDESIWNAHSMRFTIQQAMAQHRAKKGEKQCLASGGAAGDGADSDGADSTKTTMSTATATGTRRSRSTKGKGKGKGKNKAQSSAAASSSKSKATVNDKENEPPAEASLDGTQSLCENTLRMLPDETEKKKRPLVLRSPDSKEFQMGDKFSKLDVAEMALNSVVPYTGGVPTKFDDLAGKNTNAGRQLAALRTIKEEEETLMANDQSKEKKLSFFDEHGKSDKGKIMLEMKDSLCKLAEDHRDEIAAKALLELYNEWEKEGKPDELKISTIVPNAADDVRSQITRRTVLIFLELVYPGLSILSILARDLGVFVIWGLPMAWIIAMQETLRETSTRLGSATGLCGDLLGLVVVKSGRVVGLGAVMDLLFGKTQGLGAIRKHFQGVKTLPQRFHHTPDDIRAKFTDTSYQNIEVMAQSRYQKSLRHDVGLVLYCAQFVVALVKLLYGLRSFRAAKRTETEKQYGYAMISGLWSTLKAWKTNILDASAAKKTAAAVKKMKSDGLSKVEQAVKQDELCVKTCFADEAEDIFKICEELIDEVQRYGPFAAALLDAKENPTIHSMVKQPTFGSNPYVLGKNGVAQMQAIEEILRGKTKDNVKLPELTKGQKSKKFEEMYRNIDNWGLKSNDFFEPELTTREVLDLEEQAAEGSDENLVDDFEEDVEIGTLHNFIQKIWKKGEAEDLD